MNYYQGDNIGSLASVEIALHTDFAGFNPVNFLNGKGWTLVPFKDESGNMSFKVDETANGTVYTYAGRFFLQNLRNEVEETLYPFIGQRAVMRLIDMNGRVYIIGAPGTPVTLAVSGGTGDKYASENGQEFSFKSEQIGPALRL